MKTKLRILFFCFFFPVLYSALSGQDTIPLPPKWNFTGSVNLYLLPDQVYLNPAVVADYSHLHLESRYNYEDIQTASLFGGYNFKTGRKLEFNATPMLGVVFGNTNGLATGLLLDVYYGKFNIYSESEYLFDHAGKESNFFYTWSEFTYAPLAWMWFGIAAQRTKLYHTALDTERGFTLGFAKNSFAVSAYVFNVGTNETYGVLTLELNL